MFLRYKILGYFIVLLGAVVLAYADDAKEEVKLDMVTDTVNKTAEKVNAFLTGNLDFQVDTRQRSNPNEYTRDAIGRKVPKATAAKSAQSMHNDQPM